MKTLLVLAQHPDMAEAVRSAVNPEGCRVLHRISLDEAEPLLVHGLADACALDLDLTGASAIWLVEKIRRRAPKVPLVIFSGALDPQWEEAAYLVGVAHVLSKPIRPRLFAALLERLWPSAPGPAVLTAPDRLLPPPLTSSDTSLLTTGAPATSPSQVLPVLRNFSAILTHSLNAEAMLRQFLVLLRDIISVNRAAIFLRQPLSPLADATPAEPRRLRACASLGIAKGLMDHLELSLEEGIGGHVLRLGRVLRRNAEEARQDAGTQKEFELLGAQVALPLFDRESVIGVAVFDGRITGESLTNPELELIFHLLEPIGLAVKNIWLHDQLAANHQMMAGILRELSSACIVVSRDLAVLHANKTARKYFSRAENPSGELEFSDIPEAVGSKIYQVLKTGSAAAPFKYAPQHTPGNLYSVTIVPFQTQPAGPPTSVLLMAENITKSEQLRHLEVEKTRLDLILGMSDRLAHEIGNAIFPISVHQQLFREKWKDPEIRDSTNRAMEEGVKRASRLATQMRLLARKGLESASAFPLVPLLEEVYQEACKYQLVKPVPLQFEHDGKPIVLTADQPAVKHALFEVVLNGVQANLETPRIIARLSAAALSQGRSAVQIEIQDQGQGFSPEALAKVPYPFFTTRTVGVGVGLVVVQKVLELHGGLLEILQPQPGKGGVVRLTLPLERVAPAKD